MKLFPLIKLVSVSLVLFASFVSTAFSAVQTVDVLVVHSNAATTVTQGRDMPALAASFVEYANKAYKNSQVNIRFRLVHIEKVAFAGDANVSSAALTNLSRDDKVTKLREKYGADLVVLLTLRRQLGGGFACGVGYVPGGRDGKFHSGAKFGGFSVSAVNCGSSTFAHETGHNMGLGHSFAQGSRGSVHPWGRGHGEVNKFVTIMAYPQAYGRAGRVQQFSSPDQVKCNGLRCGVSREQNDGADAVGNLNSLSSQVAKFFPIKVNSTNVEDGAAASTPSTPRTPAAPPTTGSSNPVVITEHFDTLGQWSGFWSLAQLKLTSYTKVASESGLKVFNRQAYYAGPVRTVPLKTGQTYKLSTHVALGTSSSARSTARAALLINDEAGLHIQNLGNVSIVKGQWAQLKAEFKLQATGQVDKVRVLVYGPPKEWDFYMDELVIRKK
ncbi:MAG: zinc-dependent metalloprotease family protein [Methylococcales bacterium]